MEQVHPTLILQRLLEGGESLIWADRPGRGVGLKGSDLLALPITLLWTAFIALWAWQAYRQGAPLYVLAFAAPLVLYGLYLSTARLLGDPLGRRHEVYGVTDRRAIIVSGRKGRRVRFLNLRDVEDVVLVEHRNGTGTILLRTGTEAQEAFLPPGRPGPGGEVATGFRFAFIARPRYVHNLILEARGIARQQAAAPEGWGPRAIA